MKNSLARLVTWYGTHRRASVPKQTPAAFHLKFAEVNFPSAHADAINLVGWLIPAPQPRGVVILCHGIDSAAMGLLPKAAMLARHRFTTLLFDFRANGRSDGEMGTLGCREMHDVLGAVDFLEACPLTIDVPIFALGESMGGAAVVRAAARCPSIRAVVSESTFATLDDALRRRVGIFGPFASSIAEECYRLGHELHGVKIEEITPERDIAALSPRPLMLIHDNLDVLCTRSEADRLYAAAGEPKERWDVPGAPHTFAWMVAPKEYEKRVSRFFIDAAERCYGNSMADVMR